MIKRASVCVVLILGCLGLTGCMAGASDQEINQMCENLGELRSKGKALNEAAMMSKLEKDFTARKNIIDAEIKSEQRQWDDELQAKLKKVGEGLSEKDAEKKAEELEAEKKKLQEEYKAKKDKIVADRAVDLKKLGPEKEKAIKRIKDRVAKDKAKKAEEAKKCVEEAKAKGVTQKSAQCRISAKSTDEYWNLCL